MKIIYQTKFVDAFKDILDFIALDSKNSAIKFRNDVKDKIENIHHMPFKYKQSLYFENENIRELTFKGYVIVYEIDKISDSIIIIGMKKYKEKF